VEFTEDMMRQSLLKLDEEEAYIEQALTLPQVKRDRSLVQRYIAGRQAISIRRVMLQGWLKAGEQKS
jgi:hypothetical protein